MIKPQVKKNLRKMSAKGIFKKIKEDSAQAVKVRIQALLRQICILRDETCVLAPFQGKEGIPYCNGYRKDGEMIYQADHLNSRAHNVSYAEPRLVVLVCKGHHSWKHFTDNNKKLYDRIVRKIIGPERTKLWDRVEVDRRSYHMTKYEWLKCELVLNEELKKLRKVAEMNK